MSDIDADTRAGGDAEPLRPEDFAYIYPPECDRCETFAHVLEWPHPGFWYCSECGARGSGFEEPVWWHNDPLSLHYDGTSAPDDYAEPIPDTEAVSADTRAGTESASDLLRSTLGTAIIVAVVVAWLAGGIAWLTNAPLITGVVLGIVCGLAGIVFMRYR